MPEPKPSVIDQIRATLTENRDALAKSLEAERAAQAAAELAELPATEDGEAKCGVIFKAAGVSDLGVIYGIGASAGSPLKLDKDGEFLEKGDLCELAFQFCGGDRKFNVNHDVNDPIECQLVESWVGGPMIATKSGGLRTLKPDETFDPATMELKAIDIHEKSHWFMGAKPSDPELVELARKGGVSGWSWGAHVQKTEV